MTLKQLFSEIAAAIRAKNGTEATIVASDFPAEILKIQTGAPVFATEEELNSNLDYEENSLAIVYGTEYVGTYKMESGGWILIGDSGENLEAMMILNQVDGIQEEYEGLGGTKEEVEEVLDEIIEGDLPTDYIPV